MHQPQVAFAWQESKSSQGIPAPGLITPSHPELNLALSLSPPPKLRLPFPRPQSPASLPKLGSRLHKAPPTRAQPHLAEAGQRQQGQHRDPGPLPAGHLLQLTLHHSTGLRLAALRGCVISPQPLLALIPQPLTPGTQHREDQKGQESPAFPSRRASC